MQKNILLFVTITFCLLAFSSYLKGQTFKTPLSYLQYIENENEAITKDLWDYTNTVAHGKSARRVEAKRSELIKTVAAALNKISKMPGFEGDTYLRDSLISYLNLSYIVLNKDYAKILDMEEIAEQSYDLMEAYMLAQSKANEKLELADAMINMVYNKFASDHNVKIVENKNKVSKNLMSAGKAFKYYDVIYLIFFKSFKQEVYLLEAISMNDVNAIEQNRNKLIQYSSDDKKKLDTIKGFQGDQSLKTSCSQLLAFYNAEATKKIPVMTDFQLKKENFEKIKEAFDSKEQMARTQADVDQYNKALDEFKKSVDNYNKTNKELNDSRLKLIDSWNGSVSNFMNKHVPKK